MSFLRDEELGQVSSDTSSDGSDVGEETRQQEDNSHDQEDTDSEEEEEFGWREGDEAKTRELAREVLQKTLPLQRYKFLKVRFRMIFRRFVLFGGSVLNSKLNPKFFFRKNGFLSFCSFIYVPSSIQFRYAVLLIRNPVPF
jgi:hypothetical protein